jgi:hypothetical protein
MDVWTSIGIFVYASGSVGVPGFEGATKGVKWIDFMAKIN